MIFIIGTFLICVMKVYLYLIVVQPYFFDQQVNELFRTFSQGCGDVLYDFILCQNLLFFTLL